MFIDSERQTVRSFFITFYDIAVQNVVQLGSLQKFRSVITDASNFLFNYKQCNQHAIMISGCLVLTHFLTMLSVFSLVNGCHAAVFWWESCISCRCHITACNFYYNFYLSFSVFFFYIAFAFFCVWALLPELNWFDLIVFIWFDDRFAGNCWPRPDCSAASAYTRSANSNHCGRWIHSFLGVCRSVFRFESLSSWSHLRPFHWSVLSIPYQSILVTPASLVMILTWCPTFARFYVVRVFLLWQALYEFFLMMMIIVWIVIVGTSTMETGEQVPCPPPQLFWPLDQ